MVFNNLETKEEVLEEKNEEVDDLDEDILEDTTDDRSINSDTNFNMEEAISDTKIIDEIPEIERDTSSFLEVKEKVKHEKDTYLTYRVYIFKEEDTIEGVLEKYNITKEQLEDYNNLDEITAGTKLVIPSFND